MVLATVFTAGSITQTLAPTFSTVADERCRMPANIEVICVIRNTEKVMPITTE